MKASLLESLNNYKGSLGEEQLPGLGEYTVHVGWCVPCCAKLLIPLLLLNIVTCLQTGVWPIVVGLIILTVS